MFFFWYITTGTNANSVGNKIFNCQRFTEAAWDIDKATWNQPVADTIHYAAVGPKTGCRTS